jgi:hypothetical protein
VVPGRACGYHRLLLKALTGEKLGWFSNIQWFAIRRCLFSDEGIVPLVAFIHGVFDDAGYELGTFPKRGLSFEPRSFS